jgi:hypothetical protein
VGEEHPAHPDDSGEDVEESKQMLDHDGFREVSRRLRGLPVYRSAAPARPRVNKSVAPLY